MTQAPTGYVPTPGLFGPEEEDEADLLLPELPTNEEILNGTPSANAVSGATQLRQAQANERGAELAGKQNKPLWADGLGGAALDVGIITTNAATSLFTDYVDLGAGLLDVAKQSGNALSGGEFNTDEIFDDTDNPLTAARLEHLRATSQAGEVMNRIVRVGVGVFALPKFLLGSLAKGAKIISAGKRLPGLAQVATKLEKLDKAKDVRNFYKGVRATDAADLKKIYKAKNISTTGINKGFERLNKLGQGTGLSTKSGKRVQELGQADDWLKLTYKDIVNANQMVDGGRIATWMRSTGRAASGLTKGKSSVRTVGEAIGWGAFISFNEAGERDPLEDTGVTDLFKQLGLFYVPQLLTRPEESPLETKLRMMVEGGILDGVIGALLDVHRVYRFSRAYQKATRAEKAAIVGAFNTEAETLGAGMAKLADQAEKVAKNTPFTSSTMTPPSGGANAVSGMYGKEDAEVLTMFDKYLNDVEGVRTNNLLRERQQAAAARAGLVADDAAKGRLAQGMDQIQNPRSPERGGDLAARPASALTVPDQTIFRPDIQVMRPPEPTISPQTMRAAFDDFIQKRFTASGQGQEFMDELKGKAFALLPRNEVDLIDYIKTSKLQFNALGMQSTADAAISDFIVKRGLQRGYITLNDDFMLMFNRKVAFDYDRGQYVAKKAQAIDEAAELQRYNDQLAQRSSDPATGEVQEALNPATRDAQEAGRQYDDFEVRDKTPSDPASDPALVDAARKEALAATQEAGATAAEKQELIDAAAKYGEKGSPNQLAAEMLNVDLDDLPPLKVEKIGNRRYQIVDELGEAIDGKTFGTKKLADKGLEIAQKARVNDIIKKARAAAERGQDQVMEMAFGENPIDSAAVRAQVSLTQKNVDLLNKLGVPIGDRNLDLSQADLSGMSGSIRQLQEQATGSEKAQLNNIIRKVDEAIVDLGPAARRDQMASDTIADAQKFLTDGEICY